MRNKLLATAAMVVVLAFGPQARATEVVQFWLGGGGITADGWITYAPDPNATVVLPVGDVSGDPIGASYITAISGSFSDSNLGISNEAISGLVPTVQNPGNAPFATSLSRIAVPGGTLPPDDEGALTFSNLLYLGGAPDTCDDGLVGGYLDVFGMLFTLNNGDDIEVWSNGGGSNTSSIYGVAVAGNVDNVETALDYVDSGVAMHAPEPGSLLLLGTALLGILGLTRRSPDKRRGEPAAG